MNNKNDEYYIDINKTGSLPESVLSTLQNFMQSRNNQESKKGINFIDIKNAFK